MPQTIDNMSVTWTNSLTTYTGIKLNATDTASAAGSLLMDLQVGGASRFKVDKNGALTIRSFNGVGTLTLLYNSNTPALNLNAGLCVNTNTANVLFGTNADVVLSRRAAYNLRLGAADAAAPVAQTLSVQSVVAGTSNTAGANLTITGSQGTGTGAGGDIIFQVAPAGATGSSQNALATALTIASTNAITVGANGTISFPTSSTTSPSAPGIGAWVGTLGLFGASGGLAVTISGTELNISSSHNIAIGGDLRLFRDAANTLALRNGANAQTFRVYNTTDGTNSEFGFFSWSETANRFSFGTSKAGSGTERDFEMYAGANGGQIQVDAAGNIYFNKRNTGGRWTINTSGHFLAGVDNTYDIGAENGTGVLSSSPRNVISNRLVAGTNGIRINGGSSNGVQINQTGNGVLRIANWGITDFDRLQFGGTTSSFPALKRSSTTLQARLADDSAFASVQGKITTETAYTAGAPTATGYLILYDSTGTAYRVPAVLN